MKINTKEASWSPPIPSWKPFENSQISHVRLPQAIVGPPYYFSLDDS